MGQEQTISVGMAVALAKSQAIKYASANFDSMTFKQKNPDNSVVWTMKFKNGKDTYFYDITLYAGVSALCGQYNSKLELENAKPIGITVNEFALINEKGNLYIATYNGSWVYQRINNKIVIKKDNGAIKYKFDDETDDYLRTIVGLDELKGDKGESIYNALTAKTLETSRKINGVDFDGSKDIIINVDKTKTDIGLGSVDNTSDLDKPISTATQLALNSKVDKTITINGKTLNENIIIAKTDIGLNNVENTIDKDKNVYSATKLTTARKINGMLFDGSADIIIPMGDVNKEYVDLGLFNKADKINTYTKSEVDDKLVGKSNVNEVYNKTDVNNLLNAKVSKELGKGLSEQNYTSDEKSKLASLESSKFKGMYPSLQALQQAYITSEEGGYAFVDGGIGNPNKLYNWSSNENKWKIVSGDVATLTPSQIKQMYEQNADTNAYTNSEKVKLNALRNNSDVDILLDNKAEKTNVYTKTEIDLALNNRVEKIVGKQLSTEDYTALEKAKLSGIQANAEVNVQSDWNVVDINSDAYIKNKPIIPTVDVTKLYVDNAVNAKVDKMVGKSLVSDTEIVKLSNISTNANKVETSAINGNIKIDGVEKIVYTHPTGTNPHGTTKSDIGLNNVDNVQQIPLVQKGLANGVATLGADSKIPLIQLPNGINADTLGGKHSSDFLPYNPISISNGDFHTSLTTCGRYRMWNAVANLPMGYVSGDNDFWCDVFTIADNTKWLKIVAYDVRTSRVFETSKLNDMWQTWREISTVDMLKTSKGSVSFNSTSNQIAQGIVSGLTGDPNFTVMGWFKRTGSLPVAGGGVWGLGTESGSAGITTWASSSPNKVAIDLWGTTTYVSDIDYPLNQWVHVAWVKKASTMNVNSWEIYVNGVKRNLSILRGTTMSVNITGTQFVIGGITSSSTGQLYNSPIMIDETSIWNRALTQEEIISWIYRPLSGCENGLIRYYKMDETFGNTLIDSCGSGNNLTLIGGSRSIDTPY